MTVGEIPVGSLVQTRKNYQAMSPEEFTALKASLDRWGLQSLIGVTPGEQPGTWEVVDGHHRWQAAVETGRATVPVVVLERGMDTGGKVAARLAFNLRATPIPDLYLEHLRELTTLLPVGEVALLTAVDAKFLESLRMEPLPSADGARPVGDESGDRGGEPGPNRSRGMASIIALPGTDAVRALLAEAQTVLGVSTPADAVLVALERACGRASSVVERVQDRDESA
jgi:ParB-like chromosome segregation protein Spo0J